MTKYRYPIERYGEWAGNPRGQKYDPARCAYEVFPSERGAMHHQCTRKAWTGRDGLFCRQHAHYGEAES